MFMLNLSHIIQELETIAEAAINFGGTALR